jgi:hypothetical protein
MKSEYSKCPKCDFESTTDAMIISDRKGFVFTYKDRCFTHSCSWVDSDVTEHMHVICPDCGYEVGQQGCSDYKELKAKKNAKPWTGVGTATNLPKTQPGKKYVAGQGYVDVSTDGWDTSECPECPMSK